MPSKIVQLTFLSLIILESFTSLQTQAQIIPDQTLGNENSAVIPDQIIKDITADLIEGGARRGNNLFHSFQEFKIKEGGSAYFLVPSGISNILGRITGNNPSHILGKLGTIGSANVFLFNPNGFLFGQNARLDINGSFLATSASQIKFSDGTVFDAVNPQSTQILTNSVPIGLGFGNTPGKIVVMGPPHNLVAPGDTRLPNIPLGQTVVSQLEVPSGQTLALIGGEVTFLGGSLTAPSGRIEVASVNSGTVTITSNQFGGFSLDYGNVGSFQDINLAKQALLNASGSFNGNIQIFGRNVHLTDASLVFVENQGSQPLGKIKVNATDTLTITGTTQFTPQISFTARPTRGLVSQARSGGKGSDIEVSTNRLIVQNSGRIYLSTFENGDGGNLTIKASEFIKILGVSPNDPSFPISSLTSTATSGAGQAGNIFIVTNILTLQEGGLISSTVFGRGLGGNIKLNASLSIVVSGFNSNSLIPSQIGTQTQGSGTAGNLLINSKTLMLEHGGRVDSSTLASGNAGNLIINASESIEVSGIIPGSINPSLIISSANRVDRVIQQILGLPPIPSGSAGNVTINTPSLSVSNGARISVSNDGPGNAGTLTINADTLSLDKDGSIIATTRSGQGGNIKINTNNLQANNSQISATAGGEGNGGNIIINSRLVILDNSPMTANAFLGEGGNIKIVTEGILARLSPITATSELGLNGNVDIETYDSQIYVSEPREEFRSLEDVIARSCLSRFRQSGQPKEPPFTQVGGGGLPNSPYSEIDLEANVINIPKPESTSFNSIELSEKAEPASETTINSDNPSDQFVVSLPEAKWNIGDPIIEGRKLQKMPDGQVLLVSEQSDSPQESHLMSCD